MNIQKKFFLIFFSFSLTLIVLLVLLMQWSLGKGMVDYVNTKEIETLMPVVDKLAKEYRQHDSWQYMADQHYKFKSLIDQQLTQGEFSPRASRGKGNRSKGDPRAMRPPPPHFSGVDEPHRPRRGPPHKMDRKPADGPKSAHYALLDINFALVAGKHHEDLSYTNTPIRVDGVVVGYFAVSKRERLADGYELDFIEQQQQYFWLIALTCLALIALVTLPLARHVLEPIKLIAKGMHSLTQGDYQQSIDLKRQDELGQLSRDYNELALTLSENESAQKRWLANISHELRTPIAILSGEIEAMLDGIRPLTKENLISANEELQHLRRLIDDLQQLTAAEIGGMRYQKYHEDLGQLLSGEMDKYRSFLTAAHFTLSVTLTADEVPLYVDKTRINQLIENILNNAIKYSQGNELGIALTVDNQQAILIIEDNGIGIEPEHLTHVFEHLYRVEDSRNRNTGGSGLGLAICRQIVIAHQGDILAKQATLGGLAVQISLPLA